jgi:hypothetical protein
MAKYSNKLGYAVDFKPDVEDRCDFQEKKIYINSRKHAETRFYTLLHEIGHACIYRYSAKSFAQDYPMFYQHSDGRVERSRAYKVSIIAEELEAWRRGRNIARKKGLYVNDEKYDSVVTESIMTYIDWASSE